MKWGQQVREVLFISKRPTWLLITVLRSRQTAESLHQVLTLAATLVRRMGGAKDQRPEAVDAFTWKVHPLLSIMQVPPMEILPPMVDKARLLQALPDMAEMVPFALSAHR